MKYAIYVFLLLILVSCRSTKHSHTDYTGSTALERNESSRQADSTVTVTVIQDTTQTETTIQEYERKTDYLPDGTISSVSERWRSTGLKQLHTKSQEKTSKSGSEKHDSLQLKKAEMQQLKQLVDTTTDSRPVQGSEWLFVIGFIIAAVCGLIAYILYKQKKK